MKTAALALLVLCAVPPCLARADEAAPTPAGDIQGARKGLKEIHKRILQEKRKERRLDDKQRAERDKLRQLNRDLIAARRSALAHSHNLSVTKEKLAKVQETIGAKEQEAAADREFLKSDLTGLYKSRNGLGLALIFSARTPAELGARARYLQALGEATLRRVDALSNDLRLLDSFRHVDEANSATFSRQLQEAKSKGLEAEQAARQKRALLNQVASSKARSNAVVFELTRQAAAMETELDSLMQDAERREQEEREEEAAASARRRAASDRLSPPELTYSGKTSLHGRLPWPVVGPILTRFGKHLHPEFHTPVFNRGIEIGAEFGSPVRAVASGRVVFAGEMEGFGNLVVLDHGKGMLSVYGYGSQLHVSKGQRVAQGEVLEEVGESDTSKRPSLYFEIRKGVKAQDPLGYLARHA